MPELFDIDIIIPTCNRPKLLKTCLDSVANQTVHPKNIYVIDQSDNSSDVKKLCFGYGGVTYMHTERKNKSAAVNLVIGISSATYISVVDDDTTLHSNWVEIAMDAFQNTNFNVVQGQIIPGEIENNAKESRLNDTIEKRKIIRKAIITPLFKIGCNFVFRRDVLDKVGIFDTDFGPGSRFLSSDDNDWGYRVLNAGLEVLYDPRLKLAHRSWRDAVEDLKQMSDYGYALGAFFGKMYGYSKFDYAYHNLSARYWMNKEILKNLFRKEKQKPYVVYKNQFYKGLKDYRSYTLAKPY